MKNLIVGAWQKTVLSAWQKYGGRLMVLAFGPVLLWATPVIMTKAQAWFGYHLTPDQVRDYTLGTLGLIGTKLIVWLVNNGKVDRAVAEAQKLKSRFDGLATTVDKSAPDSVLSPIDDEPAELPGI